MLAEADTASDLCPAPAALGVMLTTNRPKDTQHSSLNTPLNPKIKMLLQCHNYNYIHYYIIINEIYIALNMVL